MFYKIHTRVSNLVSESGHPKIKLVSKIGRGGVRVKSKQSTDVSLFCEKTCMEKGFSVLFRCSSFLLMGSKAKQNNNSMFRESSVIKKSSYIAKQEV